MKLTANDLTILIEALDAWVEKDAALDLTMDMLERSLGPMPEEMAQGKAERRIGKLRRREVATLLQATLIRMRRDLESREGREAAEGEPSRAPG